MTNFEKQVTKLNNASRDLLRAYADSYHNCPVKASHLIDNAIESLQEAANRINEEAEYKEDNWQS